MSMHREVTFCGSDGRATFWVGACECGWQGEEHPVPAGTYMRGVDENGEPGWRLLGT